MQAQILTEEERRLAERHRQPKAVMAETAVATGIAEQIDRHDRKD